MADLTRAQDLGAMLAERRSRPGLVRDLTDGLARKPAAERVFLSPLGWLLAIVAQIAIIALVVLGVLAMPPLRSCYDREQRGFFAGETFGSCLGHGLAMRLGRFEQRIRQVILGSGR